MGLTFYREGKLDEAVASFQLALQARPNCGLTHNNLGNVFLEQGKLDEAVACYQRAVELRPDSAVAQYNLGNSLRRQGKPADAVACYRRALQTRPEHAATHYNLALVLQSQRNLDEALASYKEAVRIKPGFAEAHNNLGNVLLDQGRPDEAVACYQRAVEINPNYSEAHNNLGLAYQQQERFHEAIANFQQALRITPDYAEAYYHLGVAFQCQERFDAAATSYQQAIRIKPDLAQAHHHLGNVFFEQGKLEDAAACYQRAVEIDPGYSEAFYHAGLAKKVQGKVDEALVHLARALQITPNDAVQYEAATILPVVYRSADEVQLYRNRLIDHVARLRKEGFKLDSTKHVSNTNFHLAYQGFNDREIQQGISELWTHQQHSCPSLSSGAPLDQAARISVGFVSSFFKNHTVGKLMQGIIARLSRSEFKVAVLSLGDSDDEDARWIEQHSDEYIVVPRNLELAIAAIAGRNLDVLLYSDIGMELITSSLARTRLAPIQGVMWGHPVTTGVPTIDYFISSELLETEGAEQHYTERLIKLQTLPTYYYRPSSPSVLKRREHFGLSDDGHLYLCPQSLFKMHPEFDDMLAEILRQDPLGIIVLIEGPHRHCTDLLRRRFRRTIPDNINRIEFLPRQGHSDCLNLMAISDVMLDPVHFGGGRTNYEALAVGTPIVTMPSEFLRGRVALGLYRKIGVMDCVARDPHEYVDIAVRLGTDSTFRAHVHKRILETNALLYEDIGAVHELERFLKKAVEDIQRTSPTNLELHEVPGCDAATQRPSSVSLSEILQKSNCPACGHHIAVPFYDGGRQPLATIAWPQSPQEARDMPRLPLSFVRCVDCGHIYNSQFDYDQVPYSDKPNLMYNAGATWSDHLRGVRELILGRLSESPTVVEVGCGNGELLRALAMERPSGKYIGFDPNAQVGDGSIESRATLFDPAIHLAECRPDLIISRHVLEHLMNPLGFLQALAFAVSWEGTETRLFIEVPCIDRVLALGRTVDFFYEHNSHFTTTSLRRLLARCATEVEFVETGYNSEVVYAVASFRKQGSQAALAEAALEFRAQAAQASQRLRRELAKLFSSRQRVAIWGGTGKAAAFINQYGLDRDRFPLVVDSDPDKAGTFVPGTGQQIHFRDHLLDHPADVILIATQWRAADIVREIEDCAIHFERILIEHRGALIDYFRAAHPYALAPEMA